MGSSSAGGEETRVPTFYDPSSSPSHPLLSKHPEHEGIEAEAESYLQITYNHGPRTFQDLPFLFLFILVSLATFAFGIFAAVHHNSKSGKISSFYYDPSTNSCQLGNSTGYPESLVYLSSSSSSVLVKNLVWTLVVTLIVSGPFVLFVLWLLRHYAKQVVYISLPFFVIIPACVNVFWFVACTVSSSCRDAFPLAYRIVVLIFVFLLIGIIVWIIIANWHRIELTIRVIQIGAEALAKNLALFVVLPVLSFGLLAYFVPIVVFLVFTPKNGKVVPKLHSGSQYHCLWKEDSWVPAYFTLAIISMMWSAATMVEAQVYVISGTIAQWYFSREGSRPSRGIRTSMRNAFGPSFGTICFSGLVMAAVRFVRAVVDSARREDAAQGVVNLIIRGCANFLLSAIDFLNKFTINFAAITGETYCSSAKMTYELLRRNLLSAVFVETISTRILAGIIFILSAVYAFVVCAILKAASALEAESYFVAVLAFVLLIAILGYFVHVLENVIETIYVCYAIDRDKGDVSKQDVHEVYVLLPIDRQDRHRIHPGRSPLLV
ncbi:hypothetical protein H6P81_018499 [Aristolochia fimbriata]|uniref:Choline transporter-like protein n=1 Tax=Aristolochia fimbriata TaxID=158543 RepID=A0AAV7E3D7_ARIFI|nr:hypothetical protein H6P81_018499 [Aristolochia fimbriata]